MDRDDVAALDWILARHPTAINASPKDDLHISLEWTRCAGVLEWLMRHPEYAPWTPSDAAEGQVFPDWIMENLSRELEVNGLNRRPPASRALYVALCSEHPLEDKARYLGHCAAKQGDMDWFVEIVRDYELDVTDFAKGFLDDELGSADGFPYFIELVARGAEVQSSMLDEILETRNLVGAVWIMERLDTAADWEMAEWSRHRGHLGLLQLAVDKVSNCADHA
ncbi:hypothetical protein RI367_007388 [Sorochytrium milnesiophthora]